MSTTTPVELTLRVETGARTRATGQLTRVDDQTRIVKAIALLLGGFVGAALFLPVPGVHLVGDSAFPGQSALATALGGVKAAEAAARALPARVG